MTMPTVLLQDRPDRFLERNDLVGRDVPRPKRITQDGKIAKRRKGIDFIVVRQREQSGCLWEGTKLEVFNLDRSITES